MVIDSTVFVNSMEVDSYTYHIDDTSSLCYYDGHFICQVVNGACITQRVIKYTTLLWNDGDTVGYYGDPETDTANWIDDDCEPHHHKHHKKGIEVLLERWEPITQTWNFVSKNDKLSYDMVNQTKFPARWERIPGTNNHVFRLDYRLNHSWYTSFTPIDSEKAKLQSEPAGGGYDTFYTYPTVSYGSRNRGMLPYWGDEYQKDYEGNASHLFTSGDGHHRIKAWHDAPFPQRNLFPDTVRHNFYLLGDSIIRNSFPEIIPVAKDTVPDFIKAELANGGDNGAVGTRLIHIPGMDYPGIVYRHWVQGNRIQDGGLPIPVSSEYVYDALAPTNEFYIYKSGGKVSNKVKFK